MRHANEEIECNIVPFDALADATFLGNRPGDLNLIVNELNCFRNSSVLTY